MESVEKKYESFQTSYLYRGSLFFGQIDCDKIKNTIRKIMDEGDFRKYIIIGASSKNNLTGISKDEKQQIINLLSDRTLISKEQEKQMSFIFCRIPKKIIRGSGKYLVCLYYRKTIIMPYVPNNINIVDFRGVSKLITLKTTQGLPISYKRIENLTSTIGVIDAVDKKRRGKSISRKAKPRFTFQIQNTKIPYDVKKDEVIRAVKVSQIKTTSKALNISSEGVRDVHLKKKAGYWNDKGSDRHNRNNV